MKKYLYIFVAVATMVSCTEKSTVAQEWKFEETISLDGINPIGITMNDNDIFLSDGDHNRVVKIDQNGNILSITEGFERPMHIDFGTGKISNY